MERKRCDTNMGTVQKVSLHNRSAVQKRELFLAATVDLISGVATPRPARPGPRYQISGQIK